jgi:hypothetical protein
VSLMVARDMLIIGILATRDNTVNSGASLPEEGRGTVDVCVCTVDMVKGGDGGSIEKREETDKQVIVLRHANM